MNKHKDYTNEFALIWIVAVMIAILVGLNSCRTAHAIKSTTSTKTDSSVTIKRDSIGKTANDIVINSTKVEDYATVYIEPIKGSGSDTIRYNDNFLIVPTGAKITFSKGKIEQAVTVKDNSSQSSDVHESVKAEKTEQTKTGNKDKKVSGISFGVGFIFSIAFILLFFLWLYRNKIQSFFKGFITGI